jgi:hypothetical protein
MMAVAKEVQKSDHTIKTVVADPVDGLYQKLLDEFSRMAIRPSLPTYGEVSVWVMRWLKMLCETPTVNTVIVCHAMNMEDGDEILRIPYTGTKKGSPDLGAKLESMVDVIAWTSLVPKQDGTKEAWAQLIPAKGRNGGDRFDCLGDMRPLNIAEWLDAIEKSERGEEVKQYSLLGANVGTSPEAPDLPQEPEGAQEAQESPMVGETGPEPQPRRTSSKASGRKAA